MAFDPAINKMVLFGQAADTWTFDGTTWAQQSPATSPPAPGTMAYDPGLGKIVLLSHGETWTYDGTTWAQQSPATNAPGGYGAAMAYDPALGKIVMFNGDDTWTYDGTTWAKQSPATSPYPRSGAAMAFDPAGGNVVLFGGVILSPHLDDEITLGDTWTYDGTTWTLQSPATSPSGRAGAAMAYDPAIGQLVLFGGSFDLDGSSPVTQNDTWTYSVGTWSRLDPSISPPARAYAAMAYDQRTRQLLVFGGSPSPS
jgi:hypothetical protein